MREQGPSHIEEHVAKESRLPDKTLAFIQHAFAHGAAEVLDERRKWLLARYAVYDQLTLDEVKIYAGVTSRARAGQLFHEALTDLWEASPPQVQQRFPKEEIIRGKRTGNKTGVEFSPETRAKISEGNRGKNIGKVRSEETRTKIKISKMGHEVTPETRAKIRSGNRGQVRSEESRARISAGHKGLIRSEETKAKMREAQRQRRIQEKQRVEHVVFQKTEGPRLISIILNTRSLN